MREEKQDAEGRGCHDLERVDELFADTLDDRGHRHDRGEADHHPEDRERGAELVDAELFDRDGHPLAQRMQLHSARNATTGSSRAARAAGYTPNRTPTVAPSASATATDHVVTRAGSGESRSTSAAMAAPPSTPRRPPSSASVTDSARNWRRMSRRRAPTDLRMPISRVRSFTLISMMFMITIPPTTMPMPTTVGTTVNKTLVSRFQNSTSPSAVSTAKSSPWPGSRRCEPGVASYARPIAQARALAVGILTEFTD